jgi:hypothetical protein
VKGKMDLVNALVALLAGQPNLQDQVKLGSMGWQVWVGRYGLATTDDVHFCNLHMPCG